MCRDGARAREDDGHFRLRRSEIDALENKEFVESVVDLGYIIRNFIYT